MYRVKFMQLKDSIKDQNKQFRPKHTWSKLIPSKYSLYETSNWGRTLGYKVCPLVAVQVLQSLEQFNSTEYDYEPKRTKRNKYCDRRKAPFQHLRVLDSSKPNINAHVRTLPDFPYMYLDKSEI